jgi:hypothetical protein
VLNNTREANLVPFLPGNHEPLEESYYRCNGKHDTYGVYGAMGIRCPSKDVQTGWLEQAVWEQVEGMLRKPQLVLARLKKRLAQEQKDLAGQRLQLIRLRQALAEKGEERDWVLGLYRKGHIAENAVERQMQQIAQEEDTLRGALGELSARLAGMGTEAAQLAAARTALEALGARLEEPLSWEARRQLLESLVEQVRVNTCEQGRERVAMVSVTYRFSTSPAIRQRTAKGRVAVTAIADQAPRLELKISHRTRSRVSRQMAIMRATA